MLTWIIQKLSRPLAWLFPSRPKPSKPKPTVTIKTLEELEDPPHGR